MFLVYDNTTDNVLAEYESFHEAEQRRIQFIGMNPMLAGSIEVVDLEETLAARRREVEAHDAQPA
jgi:hypothetical protein